MNTQKTAGQTHHLAKLSDHEVECIRWQHETLGWGYRILSKWWGINKTHIRRICNYQDR